ETGSDKSRNYGLVGLSSLLSEAITMPTTMAARARRPMIQPLPVSSLSPSAVEVARAPSNAAAAGAAEATTGAAIIEVAARETAAFLSRFILILRPLDQ